jgi:hypothetical protein
MRGRMGEWVKGRKGERKIRRSGRNSPFEGGEGDVPSTKTNVNELTIANIYHFNCLI